LRLRANGTLDRRVARRGVEIVDRLG